MFSVFSQAEESETMSERRHSDLPKHSLGLFPTVSYSNESIITHYLFILTRRKLYKLNAEKIFWLKTHFSSLHIDKECIKLFSESMFCEVEHAVANVAAILCLVCVWLIIGESSLRSSSRRCKSVQVDVTGQPRSSKVRLPGYLRGSKPSSVPNKHVNIHKISLQFLSFCFRPPLLFFFLFFFYLSFMQPVCLSFLFVLPPGWVVSAFLLILVGLPVQRRAIIFPWFRHLWIMVLMMAY